ncbi:MAG: succinate dehydrogenase, cytochrome b556 subunit [Dehalococcoidia bacterium]|nr:succinate dehydrogenase, cytochrome b556 subunit [Dehalococcoidia bacterium]
MSGLRSAAARILGTRRTDLWPTNFKLGMWVWFLHRLTGVIILLYLVSHLLVIAFSRSVSSFDSLMVFFRRPVILVLELLLLAVIIFHTLNGLRIMLFDLGIGIRWQKALFWGLMGAGALMLAFSAIILLPFVSGA